MLGIYQLLADHTNSHAYATVLRPSVVYLLFVCDICIEAKQCVLEQKLLGSRI